MTVTLLSNTETQWARLLWLKRQIDSFFPQLCIWAWIWKRNNFSKRSGAIYKWISFTLHCFIKVFVLTQDWTQLVEPIHIPLFFYKTISPPFSHTKALCGISMFPGATSVTDWPVVLFFFYFLSATNLLLSHWLEQSAKGSCTAEDKLCLRCHAALLFSDENSQN